MAGERGEQRGHDRHREDRVGELEERERGDVGRVLRVSGGEDDFTNFQSKADRVFEWAVFPMSEDGERVTHPLSIDDYTMVTPRKPRSF